MTFMKSKKTGSLLLIFLIIGIVSFSMIYLVKDVKVDYSKTLPKKKIPKGPGYHRKPIVDFRDRTLVHLGDFTTNTVRDSKAEKFLKTKISVKTSNRDVSEEIQKHNILIRDAVIKALSSKRFEEIATPEGKMKLKDDISRNINSLIREGRIKEVYFTEFIIQ